MAQNNGGGRIVVRQSLTKLATACKEDILQSCQVGFMKIILPLKSSSDARPCMYVDDVLSSMFDLNDNLSPQEYYTSWSDKVIAQDKAPQGGLNLPKIVKYTWKHPSEGIIRFSSRMRISKDKSNTVIKALVERIASEDVAKPTVLIDVIQSVLEHFPVAIELWDKNVNLVDANSLSYKKFTDIKEDYIKNFYDYSPELQQDGQISSEKVKAKFKMAFDEGISSFDWTQQTRDGTPVPLNVTIVKISDDCAIVFTYDKREDIETHLQLEKSKEKQEILYENIPLGLFLWEPEKLIDCNAHLLDILDIGDKAEYLKTYLNFMPPTQENGQESRQSMLFYMYKAIEEGYCKFPFTIQSYTGEPIPVEITIYSTMLGGKTVNYCFVRSLKEEVELRKEVEKNLGYMQLVLDACPLGVSLWNTPDTALYFNYKIYAMLGLKCKADFHEAGDFFAFSPDLQPCGTSSYDKAFACNNKVLAEGSYAFEWLHVDIYGKPVPVEVTMVRTKVKGEDLLLAYVKDLREQKEVTKGAEPCLIDLADAVGKVGDK